MASLNLGDDDTEFRVFVLALRTIFKGEPWEAVAPHACRAWTAGEFGGGQTWADVEALVREAWQAPQ